LRFDPASILAEKTVKRRATNHSHTVFSVETLSQWMVKPRGDNRKKTRVVEAGRAKSTAARSGPSVLCFSPNKKVGFAQRLMFGFCQSDPSRIVLFRRSPQTLQEQEPIAAPSPRPTGAMTRKNVGPASRHFVALPHAFPLQCIHKGCQHVEDE
jgi:hypothetical protein